MSSDLVIFFSIKLLLFRKLYKNGIWVIAAKRKGVYVHLSFFNDNWRDSEMFITPAFAQSAGGLAEGGFGLLPIVFVMVIFYFLLIRPQQKRAKQHKEMLSAIRRGDKIVTSGGLTGTIVKVVDDSETVEVEIAKDIKVHVVRAMIADVKGKPEPAK
jgi:preprotein translocase subunit YajC